MLQGDTIVLVKSTCVFIHSAHLFKFYSVMILDRQVYRVANFVKFEYCTGQRLPLLSILTLKTSFWKNLQSIDL